MGVPLHKFFPMEEYYDKVVMPMDSKYRQRKGNKRVCPFHEDATPSMGILTNEDGTEIFHCFGCGKKGNIIMFHKFFEKKYHGRILNDMQALRDLCKYFNVPLQDIVELEYELFHRQIEEAGYAKEAEETRLTERDFVYLVTKGKREKEGIHYYNDLLHRLLEGT